jgi:hypothetical protein
VTIIGFVVSIGINRKEHMQRIKEFKVEKQLSDLYGVQNDVFEFIGMLEIELANPNYSNGDWDRRWNKLKKKIRLVVLSAGSEDAVKILCYITDKVYSGIDDGIAVTIYSLIAAYVLLAMQIKYDVTGVKISPNAWYIGRYTTQKVNDDTNFYNNAKEANNKIVEDLKLASFLKIE